MSAYSNEDMFDPNLISQFQSVQNNLNNANDQLLQPMTAPSPWMLTEMPNYPPAPVLPPHPYEQQQFDPSFCVPTPDFSQMALYQNQLAQAQAAQVAQAVAYNNYMNAVHVANNFINDDDEDVTMQETTSPQEYHAGFQFSPKPLTPPTFQGDAFRRNDDVETLATNDSSLQALPPPLIPYAQTVPKKTRKRRREPTPPPQDEDEQQLMSDPEYAEHLAKYIAVLSSKILHFLYMFNIDQDLPKQPTFKNLETILCKLAHIDPRVDGGLLDAFKAVYLSLVKQYPASQRRPAKKSKDYIQMRQAQINWRLSAFFVRAAANTSQCTHPVFREIDIANRVAFLLTLGWKSKRGNATLLIPFNTWKQEGFRDTVNKYTKFDAKPQWDMFEVAKQSFLSSEKSLLELERSYAGQERPSAMASRGRRTPRRAIDDEARISLDRGGY